eukprot:jgi/Mesen1/4247/ME000022S03535
MMARDSTRSHDSIVNADDPVPPSSVTVQEPHVPVEVVIGAAGGPAVPLGFCSSFIDVGVFKHECLELVEEWAAELEQCTLFSDDFDISVDELKMPLMDQLVADTLNELYPRNQPAPAPPQKPPGRSRASRKGANAPVESPRPPGSWDEPALLLEAPPAPTLEGAREQPGEERQEGREEERAGGGEFSVAAPPAKRARRDSLSAAASPPGPAPAASPRAAGDVPAAAGPLPAASSPAQGGRAEAEAAPTPVSAPLSTDWSIAAAAAAAAAAAEAPDPARVERALPGHVAAAQVAGEPDTGAPAEAGGSAAAPVAPAAGPAPPPPAPAGTPAAAVSAAEEAGVAANGGDSLALVSAASAPDPAPAPYPDPAPRPSGGGRSDAAQEHPPAPTASWEPISLEAVLALAQAQTAVPARPPAQPLESAPPLGGSSSSVEPLQDLPGGGSAVPAAGSPLDVLAAAAVATPQAPSPAHDAPAIIPATSALPSEPAPPEATNPAPLPLPLPLPLPPSPHAGPSAATPAPLPPPPPGAQELPAAASVPAVSSAMVVWSPGHGAGPRGASAEAGVPLQEAGTPQQQQVQQQQQRTAPAGPSHHQAAPAETARAELAAEKAGGRDKAAGPAPTATTPTGGGARAREHRGPLTLREKMEAISKQSSLPGGIPAAPGTQQHPGGAQAEAKKPWVRKRRGRPPDRTRLPGLMSDEERERRAEAILAMARARDNARMTAPLFCLRELREAHLQQLHNESSLGKPPGACSNATNGVPMPRPSTNYLTPVQLEARQKEAPQRTVHASESVLCVQFYQSGQHSTKAQEFLVLGSQPLSALRDRVYCLQDTIASKYSQSLPSAYFCIEDVFYNDLRKSSSRDYSQAVIAWNNRRRSEAPQPQDVPGGDTAESSAGYRPPPYSARRMDRVRFDELRLRVGARYLYLHQGGCKHFFAVTDVRLVHPLDVRDAADYPPKARYRKCDICDVFGTKFVTYKDRLMANEPAFQCEKCYHALHYSKDDALLYSDYVVYDYLHE